MYDTSSLSFRSGSGFTKAALLSGSVLVAPVVIDNFFAVDSFKNLIIDTHFGVGVMAMNEGAKSSFGNFFAPTPFLVIEMDLAMRRTVCWVLALHLIVLIGM